MNIEQIAVIGAGTMGSGIAQLLIQHGFKTQLYDPDAQALQQGALNIEKRLCQQQQKGKLSVKALKKALDALSCIDDIAAIDSADLVIEAVPEQLELKKRVFSLLDQHAQTAAVLASNTSGLDIDQLAAMTRRAEQVIGLHFFNPPPLMPLIEIACGAKTSEATFKATENLAITLGKTPIAVANSPGFAVNRILFPMINEAIFALAEGVASAEDLDRAITLGANHPLGPLALADFVGLDVTLDILDSFARAFDSCKYTACPLLREKVERGELGRKTGKGFFTY